MKAPLTEFYEMALTRTDYAMTAHLPRLMELAQQCNDVVEFGVNKGASSSALLMGCPYVTSYDIRGTKQARHLKRICPVWDYRLENTLTTSIPSCDLLLVDSLHTYAQVKAELELHAMKVRQWLVFHDVTTFGEIGADGETGRHSWSPVPGQSVPPEHLGIRPAIDELMIRDRSWRIVERRTESHGLLVLRRD